jgi:hypothetical protein
MGVLLIVLNYHACPINCSSISVESPVEQNYRFHGTEISSTYVRYQKTQIHFEDRFPQ